MGHFYYMAKNPNIQKKAQAEIDHVISSHRLPQLEVFRSMPPLISIPCSHCEDDHYKGYYLPKGVIFKCSSQSNRSKSVQCLYR